MKTTTSSSTDRVEKQVWLAAPRARVWRALTDTREFNEWFGVRLAGSFAPGARLRGPVTHPGYEHLTMEVTIERMEPERLLSWRWHPGAEEPTEAEPATLVVFELEDADNGTLLRVVESGFDSLPIARRAKAYRENEEGWAAQMEAIRKHVGAAT
jgi:uncharacterized protein YndB with AHSA1/START domain